MTPGIYFIEGPTGKKYIGSSVDVPSRIRCHKRLLEKGHHHNRYLQRAWNKAGGKSFSFSFLLICDNKNLLMYEQRALDILRPEYNVCPIAGNALGRPSFPLSDDHKNKISVALAGCTQKPVDAKTRIKMSVAKIGVARSVEARKKISNSLKGRTKTSEHLKRISLALKGRAPSALTRMRAIEANKGKAQTTFTKEKRAASLRLFWLRKRA